MLLRKVLTALITLFAVINAQAQYSPAAVKNLRGALKTTPDSTLGKTYNKLFLEFYSHSAFDSARALALEAEKKAALINDKKFQSTAMIWRGMVEFERGYYDEALAVYIEALKIKEEIKDLRGEASLLLNMAGIYYERNYAEKATEIYLKALQIKNQLNDRAGQAIIYLNLGNIEAYRAEKLEVRNDTGRVYQASLKKAVEYYNKSEQLYREVNDSMNVAVADRSLGGVLLQQGRLQEAEQQAYAAYKYLRLKRNRHFTQTLILLGKVNYHKGNYYKSKDYLEEAYQLAVENSTPFLAKDASKELARTYEKLKLFDRSLEFQRLYSHIADSLQGAKMGEQLAEMQVKYETEKKEKAIEHLANENSKKELELTRKRDQVLLISGIFICVLALFVAFYFYSNAKKQHLINLVKQRRQREIIETIITTEEKARKKIAADLHDGLGQILTAAKINLAILHEALPQEKEKLQLVTELVSSAQYESKNMALNLMPLTLKQNGLVESIKLICAKYNKPGVQEISFNSYNIPDKLESVVEINTYRICQELLNNAVKYSKAQSIFLQLFCRDGKLIIQIEDNGVGFDKSKTKADSLGMNTLKERVALLKGEIEIDTAPNKGTNIFIELALH